MTERVIVFIDGSNFFHDLTDTFHRLDIDYEVFVRKLVNGRSLHRVYYYASLPIQQDDPARYQRQQKYLSALAKKPYFSVVLGRLEKREKGYAEKGVDIALAVDMVEQAYLNNFDTAILITGDGDFAIAVKAVQRLGKHVENASSQNCLSDQLQQTCDVTTILTPAYLSDCWMVPKK